MNSSLAALVSRFHRFLSHPVVRPLVDVAMAAFILVVFHYLWWELLDVFRATEAYERISGWLAQRVYRSSLWVNTRILGMEIVAHHAGNTMLFPAVDGYIKVNEGCSGFKQMYQVLFLFLLFRGPLKHKLWFIPAAVAFMYPVNVLRVVLLSIALLIVPQHWDFVHLWVMRPFYYVAIFAEWVVWVEVFARRTPQRLKN